MSYGTTENRRTATAHHIVDHDQHISIVTTRRGDRFGSLQSTIKLFVMGVAVLIFSIIFASTPGYFPTFGIVIIALISAAILSLSGLSFYKYKQGGNQVAPSSNIPIPHGVIVNCATEQHGQGGVGNVNYATHHVQPDGGSVISPMQQYDHGTSNVPPLYHDELGNAYSYNPMQTNSTQQTLGVQSKAPSVGTLVAPAGVPPVVEAPMIPGATYYDPPPPYHNP